MAVSSTPGLSRARRPRRAPWSLARQYSVASLVVLLAGLLVTGWWVGRQIAQGVTHRAAAAASLYVENFLVVQLQGLNNGDWLSPQATAQIEKLFATTPLGREIVRIKVWGPGGKIVYGDQAGLSFPVGADQALAWQGGVSSEISSLNDAENQNLKARYGRLLEIYAPMRLEGSEKVIAVAEFYQSVDALEREIRRAQLQSWAVVGGATLLTFLLLSGLVRRGSDTISRQQALLGAQVERQSALIEQNAELHGRVRGAATRIAELHERVLGRVSSSLHDGPAQDVSYALLRLEGLSQHLRNLPPEQQQHAEQSLEALEQSLSRAMRSMRDLATDVRLPELDTLSLTETLERAVRDHRGRTGSEVSTHWQDLPARTPLPLRITAFRIVREALSNAFKHAGGRGQQVSARVHSTGQGHSLDLSVTDWGSGFDPGQADATGEHLGLVGMRERAESLGGQFSVQSSSSGTQIRVRLPLDVSAHVARALDL
jgi:signal transduction histidine kinase